MNHLSRKAGSGFGDLDFKSSGFRIWGLGFSEPQAEFAHALAICRPVFLDPCNLQLQTAVLVKLSRDCYCRNLIKNPWSYNPKILGPIEGTPLKTPKVSESGSDCKVVDVAETHIETEGQRLFI